LAKGADVASSSDPPSGEVLEWVEWIVEVLRRPLVTPAGARAFDVDQLENAALKSRRLRAALGEIPEQAHVIPADFETDDLAEYAARYLDPAGRHMPVSEIERFVHAEKTRPDGAGSESS
jgi:Leucine carboxyl methyltransferase